MSVRAGQFVFLAAGTVGCSCCQGKLLYLLTGVSILANIGEAILGVALLRDG